MDDDYLCPFAETVNYLSGRPKLADYYYIRKSTWSHIFKKFVETLDPCYELPSRRTLMRNLLPEAYEGAKKRLKNALQDTKYLALTADIWTSMHTQAYICVTGHFITSNWEIKSVVLETVQLLKDHTSETIVSELTRIAEEWEISNKITLLVTDNTSNMLAAARLSAWRHISCFAHTLKLVVTKSRKN